MDKTMYISSFVLDIGRKIGGCKKLYPSSILTTTMKLEKRIGYKYIYSSEVLLASWKTGWKSFGFRIGNLIWFHSFRKGTINEQIILLQCLYQIGVIQIESNILKSTRSPFGQVCVWAYTSAWSFWISIPILWFYRFQSKSIMKKALYTIFAEEDCLRWSDWFWH